MNLRNSISLRNKVYSGCLRVCYDCIPGCAARTYHVLTHTLWIHDTYDVGITLPVPGKASQGLSSGLADVVTHFFYGALFHGYEITTQTYTPYSIKAWKRKSLEQRLQGFIFAKEGKRQTRFTHRTTQTLRKIICHQVTTLFTTGTCP